MPRKYSFFRMGRTDGRRGGGTLLLVAGGYDAPESHKLRTKSMQALKANTATGGSSCRCVPEPRSTQAEERELLLFLSMVEGSAGKRPILGDYNTLGLSEFAR